MRRKLLLTIAIGLGLQTMAQERYLEEVFTDNQITVMKDITYGINVNPLLNTSLMDPTYVQANAAQITMEKDSLQTMIANDPSSIPMGFFMPIALDSSSILKITQLKMDVYMPEMSADTVDERPVVVFVHTGNFLPPVVNGSFGGSKEDSACVEMCKRWAKRGFVAVAPNYRHGWNPLAPGSSGLVTRRATLLNAVYRALHDIQYNIKGLRLDATAGSNTYGIDADKIAMFGMGSGGYVALAYNTLDKQSETELDKFVFGGNSVIQSGISGDINGNGGLINLYTDNGMSHDISIQVNAGGALGDISWMEAGDAPIVSFHSPYDNFAPFDTGLVIVPTTGDDVVDVNGPNTFMKKANDLGLNDAYAGEYPGDPFTEQARMMYGKSMADAPVININDPIEIPSEGMEGLYAMVVRDGNGDIEQNGSPWEWWKKADLDALVAATNAQTGGSYDADDIHNNALLTNPNMTEAQAKTYIDTIIGYSIPRMVKVMQIGNWESVNVEELYMDGQDATLYPNPASGEVMVKSNNPLSSINRVELLDINGRVVYARNGLNENFINVSLSSFASGLYLARVTLEDGTLVQQKLIVQ